MKPVPDQSARVYPELEQCKYRAVNGGQFCAGHEKLSQKGALKAVAS